MSRARGFSLLEVLVALAILGLGLTTILSSQAGLFSTSRRGANLTMGVNLGRCKMSELEVRLQRDGYPLIDEKDEGPCCEDEADEKQFTCSWLVETVVLPELGDLADGGTSDGGLLGLAQSTTGTGSLGTTSEGLGQLELGESSGPGAANLFGSYLPGGDDSTASPMAGGGLFDIATMALGMIYPTLKPMMEASIRRVSVTVHWSEGTSERTIDLTQYLTNPQQGGMLPGMPGYDPYEGDGGLAPQNPLLDGLMGSMGGTKGGQR